MCCLNEFNKINITYTYAKPKTVPEKKITYITSGTDVVLSDESLETISTIVTDIRKEIIE